MPTPEQAALWEQEIGRPLSNEELMTLDAEVGTGGTMFDAAAQPVSDDDLLGLPTQQMSPAVESPMAPEIPQNQPVGLQIPGVGPVTEGDPGQLPQIQRPDSALAPGQTADLQLTDDTPDSRFPKIDLSALSQRRPGRRAGGGGARKFGQQAAEARAEIEGARDVKADSIRDVQEGVGDTRESLVGLSVDQELAEQELQDQFKPKFDEAEEVYNQKIREFEEANRAAANIEVKDSRTRGQKILSALASAFGAVAQVKAAFAGANIPNLGAQLVNDAIERDLEEQRSQLASAKDRASSLKTEMGVAFKSLGDVREAEQVARAAIRDKYAETAKQIMGGLQDTERVSQLEGLVQDLSIQSAAEREQQALRRQQQALAAAARRRKEQQLAAQKTLEAIRKYERSQNMAGGLAVADPDKWGSLTADNPNKQADVLGETLEQVERSDEVISIIDRMQDLRSRTASRLISAQEASQELESLKNQLTAKYSKAEKLGALDQGTIDIVQGVMGDVSSVDDLLTGSAGNMMEAYRAQVAQGQDRHLRGLGLQMRGDTPLKNVQKATLQSRTRPLSR